MRTSPSRISQAREHLVTLVLLACYVGVTVQQRDPINDFCRRWGHQTAVIDDKLYIDGGLITYSGSENPENVTSTSSRIPSPTQMQTTRSCGPRRTNEDSAC